MEPIIPATTIPSPSSVFRRSVMCPFNRLWKFAASMIRDDKPKIVKTKRYALAGLLAIIATTGPKVATQMSEPTLTELLFNRDMITWSHWVLDKEGKPLSFCVV